MNLAFAAAPRTELLAQFEFGAFETAHAAFLERAALAAHVHLRVEVFDVAVQFDAALFGIDRGLVGREQALAHADLHVAAQFGIAGTAEFAGIAGDVDLRVVRIGLEQFLDARVDDGLRRRNGRRAQVRRLPRLARVPGPATAPAPGRTRPRASAQAAALRRVACSTCCRRGEPGHGVVIRTIIIARESSHPTIACPYSSPAGVPA